MYTNKDEHQVLWRAFLDGNEKALSDLFINFSHSLFDYGSRFALDERLVEDCIQDLFIKLCKTRENLPSVNNPQFYLFKSLKNIIINALIKNKRYLYISSEDLPFYAEYETLDEVEDESITEEIKEKFLSIINVLTPRQKEAIYLRYQEDMSYEEISELLNIKYQSTRNLIHRSIEKIRSEMDLKTFLFLFFGYNI